MRTFSAGARMRNMRRRSFLKVATATPLAAAAQTPSPRSGMKITRVRYYAGSGDAAMRKTKVPGLFNQSTNVVVVQTDAGITGIGEGGSKDTMEQCAAAIIGMDPFRTEQLWQILYRGYFYPAGREKLHAIGALDMALWDIKAKALNVPLYQLLGGLTRDHVECYATAYPDKGGIKASAAACVADGYRAYRFHPADGEPFDRFESVNRTYQMCREAREGAGRDGGWAIDFHTRFDLPDAVRLCQKIEGLSAYFVEDLVRSENPEVYRTLRGQVKVPIAVGEQFGDRWDINTLVEGHLIDYSARHRSQCRRNYRVPEDSRPVRDALRRTDPAFHGAYLRSRAGPSVRGILRPGADGDAAPGHSRRALSSEVLRFPRGQTVAQSAARARSGV